MLFTPRGRAAALAEYSETHVESSELALLNDALGRALIATEADAAEVEKCAFRALQSQPADPHALALLRDVRGLRSSDSHYYRLLLRGENPTLGNLAGNSDGYDVSYEVVASSPDEALELASAIDQRNVNSCLAIEECETLEPRPNEPKGVYRYNGRVFFRE